MNFKIIAASGLCYGASFLWAVKNKGNHGFYFDLHRDECIRVQRGYLSGGSSDPYISNTDLSRYGVSEYFQPHVLLDPDRPLLDQLNSELESFTDKSDIVLVKLFCTERCHVFAIRHTEPLSLYDINFPGDGQRDYGSKEEWAQALNFRASKSAGPHVFSHLQLICYRESELERAMRQFALTPQVNMFQ